MMDIHAVTQQMTTPPCLKYDGGKCDDASAAGDAHPGDAAVVLACICFRVERRGRLDCGLHRLPNRYGL